MCYVGSPHEKIFKLSALWRASSSCPLVGLCCARGFFAPAPRRAPRGRGAPVMRDGSSVTTLAVGDRVRVLAPVARRGASMLGLEGVVRETWEKCEVDPTCCCAELTEDGNLAVTVRLANASSADEPEFDAYFAEDELQRLRAAPATAA